MLKLHTLSYTAATNVALSPASGSQLLEGCVYADSLGNRKMGLLRWSSGSKWDRIAKDLLAGKDRVTGEKGLPLVQIWCRLYAYGFRRSSPGGLRFSPSRAFASALWVPCLLIVLEVFVDRFRTTVRPQTDLCWLWCPPMSYFWSPLDQQLLVTCFLHVKQILQYSTTEMYCLSKF